MTNLKRVENVLRYLAALHCREVVICAGARNAPLVVALNSQTTTKVWSLFEERSAAFFALGRIKALGAPVAVITTSGTAAAELLPATIEAHYSGLPLILVTADRPPTYRGTGAPQAIEQVGLFSNYVEASVDIWNEPPKYVWGARQPLHLNVCLEEPKRSEMTEIENQFAKWNNLSGEHHFEQPLEMRSLKQNQEVQKTKIDFFARSRKPIVVVGGLTAKDRFLVKEWLLKTERPYYLESPSGLCGDSELKPFRVLGGDQSVAIALEKNQADGVIRIGGVPTLRCWRDLEAKFRETPVISFSNQPFTGLSRQDVHVLSLNELEHFKPETTGWDLSFKEIQKTAQEKLESLLILYPKSEPGMMFALAAQMNKSAHVYLGNSLPIREWDLVATQFENLWQVEANRGANGIDGQLSTFIGFANEKTENWAFIGDLTAMYDLSAPYILRQRPLSSCNFVVINNRGGKIFSRMFDRRELVNAHDVEFSAWAKMWNLEYEKWTLVPKIGTASRPRVIELVPDEEQTAEFYKSWEKVWPELSRQ